MKAAELTALRSTPLCLLFAGRTVFVVIKRAGARILWYFPANVLTNKVRTLVS